MSLPDCPYRKDTLPPLWPNCHGCMATVDVMGPMPGDHLMPHGVSYTQVCECILARELCPEGWR